MKPEHENNLKAEFPGLFGNMKREIECESGWDDLIRALSLQMIEFEKATGIKIDVKQVKEKFGELRYYAIPNIDCINQGLDGECWSRIVGRAINQASIRSPHICEICGQHGKMRTITRGNSSRYWTLCDEHFEQEKKRNQ